MEVCFATLKRAFGMGRTLVRTLVGLATTIAAKMTAYGCYVNRLLERPQGRIKGLWACHPRNTRLGAPALPLFSSQRYN